MEDFKQGSAQSPQGAQALRRADAHEHVSFADYCHVKHFRLLDDNNAHYTRAAKRDAKRR